MGAGGGACANAASIPVEAAATSAFVDVAAVDAMAPRARMPARVWMRMRTEDEWGHEVMLKTQTR